MRTLAIETATPACSVALFEGDALIAHDHRVLGRGHAERLVPMIADLPDRGRAQRILVSRGPGSFTGVRIGIATARSLGVAWSAQVRGFATLGLVAAMARAGAATRVTVCMNGGHGEWFIADYDAQGLPVGSVQSLTPQEAARRQLGDVIAGDRAADLAELTRSQAPVHDLLPDARHVLALPASLWSEDVSALYGRAPDAELPSATGAAA